MKKLAVSRAIAVQLLVATVLLVSIVHAGSWISPSYVTEPNFCGASISGEHPLSISGDGTKIAFTKDVSGSNPCDPPAREIFVVNSDGSGLKQLTYKAGGDQMVSSSCLCISDDGSKIAFFHVDFNTWNRGIFVVNSDGTGEQQLTEDFQQDLSMSGDGSKIAFLYGDDLDFQYFVINFDGTGLTQLTHNSNNYEDMNNNLNPPSAPSISNDGSKIALEGYVGKDKEIFVVNSDGTGLKQLTDNSEDDWCPSISGDGSRITFQRNEYRSVGEYQFAESEIQPLRPQIFVINSDGTGLTQLTDDSERTFMFPCISDNGDKIAFWRAWWSHPESESEFESEVGISLVSYLSDAEDETSANGSMQTPLAIVFAFAIGVLAFTYFVYHRKHQDKLDI